MDLTLDLRRKDILYLSIGLQTLADQLGFCTFIALSLQPEFYLTYYF